MSEPLNLSETTPIPRPEVASFSRYRMKAELGRGGMGVVWRAEDTKLQREVALKFLPELVVRDREAMADLAAETRRCLELTHPNIVRVYDLVEEGTRAAISMELVDGGTLADRKLQQPDRCFTPELLGPWIAQLCSALDYAHGKVRIVHRDLKPLNLLISGDGDLKVVDFGIARSLLRSGTRLTNDLRVTSVSLGYVGPQQLLGEPAAVADDIYSLGATIYELLTGKTPFFEGDIITQLREVVPPSMASRRVALGVTARESIPLAWEETVAACLAKKAEDRPSSVGEVAARLGFPSGGNSRCTQSTSPIPLARTGGDAASAVAAEPLPAKNHRVRWILGLAGAAAAAASAAAFFWLRGPTVETGTPPSVAQRVTANVAGLVPPAAGPEFLVTIQPPDVSARVWLGQESNKAVPADGRLAFGAIADGEHDLTVQASGYQTYTAKVKVKAGRGTAEVALIPVYGTVVVVARAGTVVTAIDGNQRAKPLGTVPAVGSLRVEKILTVGTYRFEFSHPDCASAQQTKIAVTAGREVRVAPAQTALPGTLRVFSVPDGADVLVNGTKVGVTPADLANQPGEKPLTVEIFLAGYRREKRTLTLKPREIQTLELGSLTLEGGAIDFRIGAAEFRLQRATVWVDGHEFPLKAGKVEGIEVGKREVELRHPDYEPWKQTVTVLDRQRVSVPVKLVAKPAELTFAITGPSAFTLTANGKAVPVKNHRASVTAGEEVALEIAARGFKTDRRKLTLPARGKQTITLAMTKVALAETGQPWTIPDVGITLLPVAAGAFSMGSATGDPTERPVTQVKITKPFWLGRTEVAQREWAALMESNPSAIHGENLPVGNVSWAEATAFCKKLTDRERAADRLPAGYVYALPTEAQWEYAARAGDQGEAPADIAESSWHAKNSGETMHPVAGLKANAWGFHDLHGNVWEWCADLYAMKLPGGIVSDPQGATGTERVRRGGSYALSPAFLRYAARGKGEPELRPARKGKVLADLHTFNVGFRVALAPGP